MLVKVKEKQQEDLYGKWKNDRAIVAWYIIRGGVDRLGWNNKKVEEIMTYNEAIKIAKSGKTLILPNFIGYFKWDFGNRVLVFTNGDYRCNADDLNVKNRTDWYYII